MDRDESISSKDSVLHHEKIRFQMLWLAIDHPTLTNHFDMNPVEFRDSLALRYGHTPCKMNCETVIVLCLN